ncbi:hypothetical protein P4L29_30435 [Bacillus cereus]|nr:hypothetical protein [Bacillus cereus]
MKVTRDTLHEMIDKVNESELHKIYDVLQSIVNYPPLNVLTDCLKWGLLG